MDRTELRLWLGRQEMKPEDLARELGRYRSTVYRWLSGESPVPKWVPLALAELERRRTDSKRVTEAQLANVQRNHRAMEGRKCDVWE